jgi:predicted metal-dependent hydrolase
MADRSEKISLGNKESDRDVLCYIRKSNRARRISLRIESSEKIILTLPRWATLQQGRAFLLQQRKWIEKRIENSPPVIGLITHLQTGGQIWLSSHPRTLNLIDVNKMANFSHQICYDQITLNIPKNSLGADEEVFSFLQALAKENLTNRVFILSKKFGFKVKKVRVGNQKSRWGSCSSKGTISLNWRLLLLSYSIGQYVILHELAHLKHLNHSLAFWQYLESICPGARIQDRELRNEGKRIINLGR